MIWGENPPFKGKHPQKKSSLFWFGFLKVHNTAKLLMLRQDFVKSDWRFIKTLPLVSQADHQNLSSELLYEIDSLLKWCFVWKGHYINKWVFGPPGFSGWKDVFIESLRNQLNGATDWRCSNRGMPSLNILDLFSWWFVFTDWDLTGFSHH